MPSTRSAEKRARRNLAAAGDPTPLRRSPRGVKMQVVEEKPAAVASPEKLLSSAVANEKSGSQRKRAAGQSPAGAAPASKAARGSKKAVSLEIKGEDDAKLDDSVDGIDECQEEDDEVENKEQQPGGGDVAAANPSPAKKRVGCSRKPRNDGDSDECCFIGNPIPLDEAKSKWPERYKRRSSSSITMSDPDLILAKRHYLQANVDGVVYNLYDDAYIKAGDGEPDYIGRIVEFFESTRNEMYFTAQWFFRAEDTVMKEHALCHTNAVHDSKRVFLSNEKNDNSLDCIVSKIKIVRVLPNIDLKTKQKSIPPCDLYYDTSYSLSYSTFSNLTEETRAVSDSSTISSESNVSTSENKSSLSLLDLYSGCGAMSTGLCLGANLSGTHLETRWAVDFNKYACESLKLNHPNTEVRNEKAEDFLRLLVEWEGLCKKYDLVGRKNSAVQENSMNDSDEDEENNSDQVSGDEFEVGRIVGVCYGDPHDIGKVGLKFKVRWKGYGPSEDTWEPIDGLSNCEERVEDFVRKGFQNKILPLPGDADVICGGPPCQGISGFNRFRNREAPLEDPKNQQMVVFMDIVEFLKPRFVLMENVVDILKFANGFLGRYALSRLVSLNYQARLGMMVAGCYGLPQFRMRVFLWGALPTETLPQFPLPTHDVVIRGVVPNEFEQNVVAYDATQKPKLNKALFLEDALSDLPKITNFESRDEMPYTMHPKTEFQRFIRLSRTELLQSSSIKDQSLEKHELYDHRPLQLNEDDYQRVCQIPKNKGANFRDLPGVMVGPDNISMLDPNVERVMLPSGKPLVPDYAITFVKGKSSKPFGRLWWDETVPTVVTRAEPHNQAVLHPAQDRVLSIRENARLQGFPDFYKLCGPIKERYIQVGNAVAVPVARALGYSLGLSVLGNGGREPLFTLPQCFPLLNRTDECAESMYEI